MNTTLRTATLTIVLLVGLLAGVLLERLVPPAQAQTTRQFTECTSLSLHWHDGAAFSNPSWRPQTITIRQGWTAVGGTNVNGVPYAVVCR